MNLLVIAALIGLGIAAGGGGRSSSSSAKPTTALNPDGRWASNIYAFQPGDDPALFADASYKEVVDAWGKSYIIIKSSGFTSEEIFELIAEESEIFYDTEFVIVGRNADPGNMPIGEKTNIRVYDVPEDYVVGYVTGTEYTVQTRDEDSFMDEFDRALWFIAGEKPWNA